MRAKCKDCLQDIQEWGSKKDHTCKQCYIRKVNCKNRGIEYVPVKDLDEKEREKVFKRRGIIPKNTQTTVKKTRIKETSIDEVDIEQEKEIVRKDMINTFEANGISYPLDSYSLWPIMQMLKPLFDNYEEDDKKISTIMPIEDKMSTDYSHSKEHYSSLYYEKYLDVTPEERKELKLRKETWEERHNILLYYRRQDKNVVTEHEIARDLILSIVTNKDIRERFYKDYEILANFKNASDSGSYKAEMSSLVEKEDFVDGFKGKGTDRSKYVVIIKTYFLGQPGTFKRPVEAYSEEDAKQIVYDFIRSQPDKFKFTWVDRETTVEKVRISSVKRSPQQ